METRKVLILINEDKFTQDAVRKEIKEEGFPYNFCFETKSIEYDVETVKISDEVWLWGECEDKYLCELARELGKDIWEMA